jgi:hypothetical protein
MLDIDTPPIAPYAPPVAAARIELGRVAKNAGAASLAALPGLLTIYLSFNSGGYFAGAQGAVVAALAFIVAARMALVRDPFGGFSRPLLVAIGALGAYALWSLLSSHWSHSPARALLDFDLANVYLFALILFGSSARSHRRVRWTVVVTCFSMFVVCVVSLATRLRPDLFPIPTNLSPTRLAFPLTYWNALGLFAVIGIILALHLASSTREPRLIRVLGTASLPIFAVTILLTFSRSALVVGGGGLLAYAALARPRGLLSAVLAAGPPAGFVLTSTYSEKLIANASTSAAAVSEGRHLVTVILACCLAAGLIRVALLEVDARLSEVTVKARIRHALRGLLALMAVAAVLVTALTFGHQIKTKWNNFLKADSPVANNDVRNRIDSFRIGGRLAAWHIAIERFDIAPLHGDGAGTFANDWYRLRPNSSVALETHSLYLEAMSELGVVGVATIVLTILLLIGGCFARARRGPRSFWTALGVVGLVWAVHAGLDWDWEMPAVTLPVVALTGCALARRGGRLRLPPRAELALRVGVGLVALAVAITAARISVSDNYLSSSLSEFNSGACPAAVANARSSIAALPERPQPYSVIGYCDVLTGNPTAGVPEMEKAIALDPQDWNYYYGLAVAQAAAGRDPEQALSRARTLDPGETMIMTAFASLRGHNPRRWREGAKSMQMPVSMQG